MSSFEEVNLYDDLLDSSESAQNPLLLPASAKGPFLNGDRTKGYILQEVVESGSNAEVNILKSVKKKQMVDGGKINVVGLVESLIKDGYDASLCHSSWPTTLNCPGGEHEYIDILDDLGKKQTPPRRIIADTDFKSQFELARPTAQYQDLCDILPPLFVGDQHKLERIIAIMCGEATNSFRERGLHLPPWRTPCYMLSKWRSPKLASSLKADHHQNVLFFSSKMMPRSKHLRFHGCGLSTQFSSMTIDPKIPA